MNLKPDEALAFLNKFKGSLVSANLRITSDVSNDSSIGVVRVNCKAILVSCDGQSLSLNWSEGRMFMQLEDALFSFPDAEQTAPVGLEIMLSDGVKCVICPVT